MRSLLERMAEANRIYFAADRALVNHKTPETLQVAKEAAALYHEAEHREYQAMVEDGVWSQEDCDESQRWARTAEVANQAWLDAVEEGLKNPSVKDSPMPTAVVNAVEEGLKDISLKDVLMSTVVVNPIAPVPSSQVKSRDRAFF